MATFTTLPNRPAQFDDFDIDDLHGNYLYLANATTWRVGAFQYNAGTFIQFLGNGFTYTGGALTGGTITSIASFTAGVADFQISGLSLSAATYHAYSIAHDTEGFLAAVFAGADDISGSNLNDHLYGYAGNDKLTGLDGDDILDGGAGSDTLIGGKGNDIYIIDSVGDVIQEKGASTGDVVKSAISVDLNTAAFLGIEHITLSGKADIDATGNSNGNFIIGNSGNNTIAGGLGHDVIQAGSGNDILDGGKGDDTMYGGNGDDTYYVDNEDDLVLETILDDPAHGIDTVYSSLHDYVLPDYVENLVLTGAAVEGFGNDLDNKIAGNDHGNSISGFGGADVMTGGGGNDNYYVDDVNDKVIETDGNDAADLVISSVGFVLPQYVDNLLLLTNGNLFGTGNDLRNLMYGNGGENKLDGGAGNDILVGKSGDDTLIGGLGNDELRGESGDDIADVSQGNDTVFYSKSIDGYDIVQGFDGNATGGQDVLSLDEYFDYIGIAADDRAGRVGVIDNGATVDIWIDFDGNKFLDNKIATLNTVDAVTIGQDILVGS